MKTIIYSSALLCSVALISSPAFAGDDYHATGEKEHTINVDKMTGDADYEKEMKEKTEKMQQRQNQRMANERARVGDARAQMGQQRDSMRRDSDSMLDSTTGRVDNTMNDSAVRIPNQAGTANTGTTR